MLDLHSRMLNLDVHSLALVLNCLLNFLVKVSARVVACWTALAHDADGDSAVKLLYRTEIAYR